MTKVTLWFYFEEYIRNFNGSDQWMKNSYFLGGGGVNIIEHREQSNFPDSVWVNKLVV